MGNGRMGVLSIARSILEYGKNIHTYDTRSIPCMQQGCMLPGVCAACGALLA
jgi:hypothetical protein